MENNILVSVVMITYAHERYIEQAIESVLMQEYNGEIELIVANDNYPDDSDSIIKKIIKEHPRGSWIMYTNHPENKGMMENSIWALKQAKGKYIALCEGDDYWTDPLKLQKQVDFLETNQDYSMCFHNANRLYQKKEFIRTFHHVEDKDYLINEVFLHWIVPTASIVLRREVLSKINKIIKDKRILNGDIIVVLSAFEYGKVRGFSDAMSTYRVHDGGISQSRISENNIKHLLNYISHYMLIREKFLNIDKKVFNIKLVDNYMSISFYYLKRKKIQFLYYLFLAIYHRPDLITKTILKLFKRK
jgi:glycosyltransferase involved in cell wall biosynthesis